MYILGLIQHPTSTILIDPKDFSNVEDMYQYLDKFFSKENFELSEPITMESLESSLKEDKPVLIPFNGSKVALMMGEKNLISKRTSRFLHAGLIDEFLK